MKLGSAAGAAILTATVAVLATACGLDTGRACTAIGAISAVTVNLHMEAGTTYRLCAGARCQTRTAQAQDAGPSFLQVALPDSVGAGQVPVRFTATRGTAGRPVADERRTVTLTESRPNGPGCDPTVYQASLTYEPATGLAPRR